MEAVDKKEEMETIKKPANNKIVENFATPLVGQFLNLPETSVPITCRACQMTADSEIRNDLKWYWEVINCVYSLGFLCCCCCFFMDFIVPCRKTDKHHYCKHCGCYFGCSIKPKANILKNKKK